MDFSLVFWFNKSMTLPGSPLLPIQAVICDTIDFPQSAASLFFITTSRGYCYPGIDRCSISKRDWQKWYSWCVGVKFIVHMHAVTSLPFLIFLFHFDGMVDCLETVWLTNRVCHQRSGYWFRLLIHSCCCCFCCCYYYYYYHNLMW